MERESEAIREDPLPSPVHHTRCFPCFGSSPTWWDRVHSPTSPSSNPCWTRGLGILKKLREWSEITCGPKWKTFIRNFGSRSHRRPPKFQYDPLSYALNFDHGQTIDKCNNLENEFRDYNDSSDFSSRYAAVSPSRNKSPRVRQLEVVS